MNERINLEATLPGEHVRRELEARGWTQRDLAAILGRTVASVNKLLNGMRSITPAWAKALGEAFNEPPEFFLNLQSSYDLSKVRTKNPSVRQLARLYDKAPIREMQKRGWIGEPENVEILEAQVCQFFGIRNMDESIQLPYAARTSTEYGELSGWQLTWLHRARRISKTIPVKTKYTDAKMQLLKERLSHLKIEPEEIRHIPRLLSEYGIRFLIVEHLPHTKIDGICFWLDKHSPVIAISMRYDRIDWFWHTLAHELAHVNYRDGEQFAKLDISLVGSDAQPKDQKKAEEIRADEFAERLLVDQAELEDFIARIDPLYSTMGIVKFARRLHVFPGIVVGQLQHKRKIAYSHSRDLLVRVRHIITKSALTDGWGNNIPF